MKANPEIPIQPSGLELRQAVLALLADRHAGMLTQREFEEQLGDFESALGADQSLDQRDLRGGGTRILVRCRVTGDILDLFDFRPNMPACD